MEVIALPRHYLSCMIEHRHPTMLFPLLDGQLPPMRSQPGCTSARVPAPALCRQPLHGPMSSVGSSFRPLNTCSPKVLSPKTPPDTQGRKRWLDALV